MDREASEGSGTESSRNVSTLGFFGPYEVLRLGPRVRHIQRRYNSVRIIESCYPLPP